MADLNNKQNILLILTDQQRWDSLGCTGTPGVHTPILDRLASEGTRYDRCYVNGTICTPSRASLWTGKHLPGHGVYALHDCLPEDEVLFPKRLQTVGYETALFGKLHVSGHYREAERRHPNDGFDLYEWASDPSGPWGIDNAYLQWLEKRDPELREVFREKGNRVGHIPIDSHMTTWAAERAIDYLSGKTDSSAPFFCCMSVFDPHSPYTNYPEIMAELIDSGALPPVVAADQSLEGRPIAHEMELRWGTKVPDSETLAAWRVGYHAAITLIDTQVGLVLDVLESQGLRDNTLVIFTSDHGDMMGDHGLMTKGAYFYDACTRVPMVVRNPDSTGDGVVSAPCQLHDIAGTCLRAAGQGDDEIAEWSPDGVGLLDLAGLQERNRAACLYRNSGSCSKPESGYRGYFDPPIYGTMWFEPPYKMNLFNSSGPDEDHPHGELYDLESDPQEMESLWEDPEASRVRARMVLRSMDWLTEEDINGRIRGEGARPAGFLGA